MVGLRKQVKRLHRDQVVPKRQQFLEVGRLPQTGRKFDRWLDLVLMQRTVA